MRMEALIREIRPDLIFHMASQSSALLDATLVSAVTALVHVLPAGRPTFQVGERVALVRLD